MASRDDERFRIRPSPPKSRTGPRPQRFISQVLKEASKAGASRSGKTIGRPANTFGRGRVAATLAGRSLGANARRVIVKSRFVVLQRASPHSVAVHLRYIEREGVTRDGQKGQAYGADTDAADLQAFEERGQGDRHQFRFIVSPEDGLEIEDLKGLTRQLMRRMEIDLETRLDWVAVDHWDTDNPHTHIVLNGHTASGEHLVIAPDYMAHGMRQRASEIATEWLGPRTEAEMRQSLLREVDQQRLTSLDRALIRQTGADGIDFTEASQRDRQRQNVLRARLQRLEGMGLAEQVDAHRWTLKPGLAATLNALGEREDALHTMRRALAGQQRELVIGEAGTPVLGRIAGKGLADELHDRGYLVVDGIDGRAHYLKLPAGADLGGFPVGAIVEAGSPAQQRAVDRHILAASRDGIYTTASHAAQIRQAGERDPQAVVEIHVRRLEALRRAGVVERIGDGIWKVPPDLPQQAQRHDMRKAQGLVIELRSHLPIEQQVRTVGATWLDRQLLDGGKALTAQGFGAQARETMERRADFLAEQGLTQRRGQRVVLARNLLTTLRERELAQVGKQLEVQTGRSYRPLVDGQRASGVYRQSVQLASGRFAMLDDGLGFSLVPWQPVIEHRLGQQISGIVRDGSSSWSVGRQRGPSVG
ncbi:MAG: conjugal transfer protein [Variovorax paradoxus]|uniref:Conjugal transfer protein n=1 Tax=Variovorax paradoxus TaxID=34073 RepID=A0A2W5QLL0_VARPD|nr:MAG: conjugal transfer protein [Variovorax paradoxus]